MPHLTVSCRIGKDPGRAREASCRNWSKAAQSHDTMSRTRAKIRYAENALIWIACYGVRFKCDKVTKNFAVQGEMHGKFFGRVAGNATLCAMVQSSGFDSPSARNA